MQCPFRYIDIDKLANFNYLIYVNSIFPLISIFYLLFSIYCYTFVQYTVQHMCIVQCTCVEYFKHQLDYTIYTVCTTDIRFMVSMKTNNFLSFPSYRPCRFSFSFSFTF